MKDSDLKPVAFSSSARPKEVPVPESVLKEAGFAPGDPVAAIPLGNGEFVFAKVKPDTEFAVHGNVKFGPAQLEKAGLTPGQPLKFTVLPTGAVRAAPLEDPRADESFQNPPRDSLDRPVPPAWLIQAFTNVPSVEKHIRNGDRQADLIAQTVSDLGKDIADFDSILDFGCGVGRVLRGLPRHTKAKLIGCDLHEDAIAWLSQHMPEHRFLIGTEYPPVDIPDDSVDLMYAISVLTHLDEDHQIKWLEEWARVLKPGGVAIVTFRNEEFLEAFVRSQEMVERVTKGLMNDGGFVFESHQRWQGVFSEFYADAYHTKDYIRRVWGRYFEVRDFKDPGTFITRQNAAIMVKPG